MDGRLAPLHGIGVKDMHIIQRAVCVPTTKYQDLVSVDDIGGMSSSSRRRNACYVWFVPLKCCKIKHMKIIKQVLSIVSAKYVQFSVQNAC